MARMTSPSAFQELASVHRGWCNYCKGNVEVCRACPEGGCSLRDYERELSACSEKRVIDCGAPGGCEHPKCDCFTAPGIHSAAGVAVPRCSCGYPEASCSRTQTDCVMIAQRSAPSSEARTAAIHANDCPTFRAFWMKHALGSKTAPSCLMCGHAEPDREQWAITHMELPDIYICKGCVDISAIRNDSERT